MTVDDILKLCCGKECSGILGFRSLTESWERWHVLLVKCMKPKCFLMSILKSLRDNNSMDYLNYTRLQEVCKHLMAFVS